MTPAALRERLAASLGSVESAERGIDVVVPIHDAYQQLERCLWSVAHHTDVPYRLVLIDDGSSDPGVAELLCVLETIRPGVAASAHAKAQGFVRSANEGFAGSTRADVVLLNSDTVVTAGWLSRLKAAAGSRARVATVTPLTNNGTLCTVPDVSRPGPLPPGWSADAVGAIVARLSLRARPETPTGVGFCMYVTRAALDAVGAFDAETFGDGYGEENDFCQRAIAQGFVNLIADDAFVYHEGGASFGDSGRQRIETNLRKLAARHPTYAEQVSRYYAGHPLETFHRLLRIALRRPPAVPPAPRVMHVLHAGGGTERHARDLCARTEAVSFLVRSDGSGFDVEEHGAGRMVAARRLPFPAALPRDFVFDNGAYRVAFDALCEITGAGVVHVHHLLGNTLDIASVADERGIPYVVTLHDYFALCPRYTLLRPDGAACTGCRTDPRGPDAAACLAVDAAGGELLDAHQRRLHRFLCGARRIFAPSAAAAAIVLGRYPDLADRIAVVEHGLGGARLPPVEVDSAPRTAGNPLRLGVIGALNLAKGQNVLLEMLATNGGDELEFHFFGAAEGRELSALPVGQAVRLRGSRITYHGRYAPGEIVARLRARAIDVGLLLSTWPETFSYTLSEYAMAGIPVVAFPAGAVAERVARDRLGWIVEGGAPAMLERLRRLAADPSRITSCAAAMDQAGAAPPLERMQALYAGVYRALAASSRVRDARRSGALPTWEYLLSIEAAPPVAAPHVRSQAELDLDAWREWMRSPRYVIADRVFDALARIPLLWPLVVRWGERAFRASGSPR